MQYICKGVCLIRHMGSRSTLHQEGKLSTNAGRLADLLFGGRRGHSFVVASTFSVKKKSGSLGENDKGRRN